MKLNWSTADNGLYKNSFRELKSFSRKVKYTAIDRELKRRDEKSRFLAQICVDWTTRRLFVCSLPTWFRILGNNEAKVKRASFSLRKMKRDGRACHASFYLLGGFVRFYLASGARRRARLSFFPLKLRATWFTQRCRLSLPNDVKAVTRKKMRMKTF